MPRAGEAGVDAAGLGEHRRGLRRHRQVRILDRFPGIRTSASGDGRGPGTVPIREEGTMKRAPAAVLALLLLRGPPIPTAGAADLSGIYDRPTLAEAAERYQRSTTKIMNKVIWPALQDEHRRRLGQKPALEFPLWADDPDSRGHPLAFYTPIRGHKIVLPALSLKFLDDLCTAYAWLQINRYNIET